MGIAILIFAVVLILLVPSKPNNPNKQNKEKDINGDVADWNFNETNPATGLPMMNDFFDIKRNPYGCDNSDES
jgi:hypothetical protein